MSAKPLFEIQREISPPSEKEEVRDQLYSLHDRTVKTLDKIFSQDLDESLIESAEKIADEVTFLAEKKDFLEVFKNFKEYSSPLFTHSFLVCLTSTMICRRLEWKSTKTLKAIALGGLLHDIGMSKIPEEVRHLHVENMDKEQLVIYKTHPEEGVRMAARFPQIPAAVLQIIFQHHENGSRGFPHGLSDSKIYPLAKVIFFAEKFSQILIEKNLIPVDGLRFLLQQNPDLPRKEPELTKALIKSFIKDEKMLKEKK